MSKTGLTKVWLIVVAISLCATSLTVASQKAEGAGSYMLGPGLPTIFSFDRDSMSCAVSWGTLGAPGPGPFSDPKMKLDKVNFGMVVFSLSVTSFEARNNRVTMIGQARSITTVNEQIVENAIYQFTVQATDGGALAQDRFSMALQGKGLMFDGHTFEPVANAGLVGGNVVIQP